MSSDDHSGNDQRQDRGDSDKPTRDARGRWLPGNCPNPKGRPKKKPTMRPDQSDIYVFRNTVIGVLTSGQKEMMDRRTALLNKMFESAMTGKVSMQRFLYKEFRKNDEVLAATIYQYERLMMDWYAHPSTGKPRGDIPLEVELERMQLWGLLNHYFPGAFPLEGVSANDDDDDG
jgi:hypothetical protein